MTQVEQVVGALERCGGYATFSELNQHVDTSAWGTKTPAASIRGIVQTHQKLFYRIVSCRAMGDGVAEAEMSRGQIGRT